MGQTCGLFFCAIRCRTRNPRKIDDREGSSVDQHICHLLPEVLRDRRSLSIAVLHKRLEITPAGCVFAIKLHDRFATIATLIVLASLLAEAAATNDVAIAAIPMVRATASIFRLRTLPARLFCMVGASS